MASGVEPGELDRVLDRLGARIEERAPCLSGNGDAGAETLRKRDVALVRDDREVRVEKTFRLLHDLFHDPG